jgi:iron complex outermembrane receptor protein
MKKIYFIIWYLIISTVLFAQSYSFKGIVVDEHNHPLPGANIVLEEKSLHSVADENGQFELNQLSAGTYTLRITFVGYEPYQQNIQIPYDLELLKIRLHPGYEELEEIIIEDRYEDHRKSESSHSVEIVDQSFIKQNLAGSLMKSLEKIPGISTIDIGSGQSKPVIRGLSFNRVVVIDEGIKHQAQQWSVDHGLEVDQYAVERVEVVKGPASLMYGSDAIGGIVDLQRNFIPARNHLGGSIELSGKTNNQLAGASVQLHGRKEHIFLKGRFTYSDYGDYTVPTDRVEINTYNIDLHNNHLRNTAGNERNIHLTLGYVQDRVNSQLSASYLYTKSGFFANAHGREIITADSTYDASSRDVNNPYQEVNHLKAVHKTKVYFENSKLETELGYQYNLREEHSNYTQHGFRPPELPAFFQKQSTLERGFEKQTISGNARWFFNPWSFHELALGINLEGQQNKIDGYGFVIPTFTAQNGGLFLYDKMHISEELIFHAGLRYDLGRVKTEGYQDWFQTPILDEINGDTLDLIYIQRAPVMDKLFHNYSWSLGMNRNLSHARFKINVGKSFRMPTPKELAADGINYHMYRYEIGDSLLTAESSYQMDMGFGFRYPLWSLNMSPFVNYFDNYIFLNPTAAFREGVQVFRYTQSEVFRYGGELTLGYTPIKWFETSLTGEYLYAEQLSGEKKGFTLPFSPPPSLQWELLLKPDNWFFCEDQQFSIQWILTAQQENIVPPEKKTPGYQVLHLGYNTDIVIGNLLVTLNFQVRNTFNEHYFNHTSFYRLINVPEPGRNFVLNVKIPIEN